MNFYTRSEFKTEPSTVWASLAEDGEVILTDDGKPSALMLDVASADVETLLKAFRQAKSMIAFNAMRQKAQKRGFMTDAEIESEIAAYRREKRGGWRQSKNPTGGFRLPCTP
jgi:hypothetical protein